MIDLLFLSITILHKKAKIKPYPLFFAKKTMAGPAGVIRSSRPLKHESVPLSEDEKKPCFPAVRSARL